MQWLPAIGGALLLRAEVGRGDPPTLVLQSARGDEHRIEPGPQTRFNRTADFLVPAGLRWAVAVLVWPDGTRAVLPGPPDGRAEVIDLASRRPAPPEPEKPIGPEPLPWTAPPTDDVDAIAQAGETEGTAGEAVPGEPADLSVLGAEAQLSALRAELARARQEITELRTALETERVARATAEAALGSPVPPGDLTELAQQQAEHAAATAPSRPAEESDRLVAALEAAASSLRATIPLRGDFKPATPAPTARLIAAAASAALANATPAADEPAGAEAATPEPTEAATPTASGRAEAAAPTEAVAPTETARAKTAAPEPTDAATPNLSARAEAATAEQPAGLSAPPTVDRPEAVDVPAPFGLGRADTAPTDAVAGAAATEPSDSDAPPAPDDAADPGALDAAREGTTFVSLASGAALASPDAGLGWAGPPVHDMSVRAEPAPAAAEPVVDHRPVIVASVAARAAALAAAEALVPAVADAPGLRRALVDLAREDSMTAGALLTGLLPAQGAVLEEPVSYDLTVRGFGTFAVTVGSGGVEVQRLTRRRPRKEAAFHISGEPLVLAELLAGDRTRLGRFRPSARITGRRKRARALRELPASPLTLAQAVQAGARLEPWLVFTALPYAVAPEWTRGHVFTVAQEITELGPRAWYVTARDGVRLSVVEHAAGAAADATVTMSRAAFDRLLKGEPATPGDLPVIRGDRTAVATLKRWTDLARG